MRVLSLFSGIGAFEKALTNIGINYDIINFSEIDKYAVKSYCSLHNISNDLNLGDITKIKFNKLPKDIDLLTHGSPCTDFSLAGKNLGGDKNSGTRSSLLWNSVEIIKKIKPKIVVWENVANVLSGKHKHNFEQYLSVLDNQGYWSDYVILNAKNFGVAQNRVRLLCISILKDYKDEKFKNIDLHILEQICKNKVVLRDIIEKNVASEYTLKRKVNENDISKRNTDVICIGQSSNKGSQGGKVYSIDGIFPTLCAGTHGYSLGYIKDEIGVYRQLTPLEVFKLMGFSEDDYNKCKNSGNSKTQLYKQAGNSIVVTMLEELFKVLFNKECIEYEKDI